MEPALVGRSPGSRRQGGSRGYAVTHRAHGDGARPGRRSEADRERAAECAPDARGGLADRLRHGQRRLDRIGAAPFEGRSERQDQRRQPGHHARESRDRRVPVHGLRHQSRQVPQDDRPDHPGRADPPGDLPLRRRRAGGLLVGPRGDGAARRIRVGPRLVPDPDAVANQRKRSHDRTQA